MGVRRKTGNTGSVAVGMVQRIVAEHLHLGTDAHVAVHYQLVLFEIGFGNVAIDVASLDRGTIRSAWGSGIWGAGVDESELVEAARIHINDGKGCGFRELTFHT